MKLESFLASSFALLVSLAPFACDDDRDRFGGDTAGEFDDASPDVVGTCQTGLRCSTDLRSVVDGCDESRVVTACAADQGCLDARCVPACNVSASASVGCEFAALPPSHYREGAGSCFAAFVANTWSTATHIEAEYAGTAVEVTKSGRLVQTSGETVTYAPFSGDLQPGEVAVLFLGQAPGPDPSSDTPEFWVPCPDGTSPAVLEDTSIQRTGRGKSFRIRASLPVSAYSMYPFGGASSYSPSATLLLPVPAWQTDYVVADAWDASSGNPATQILAAEDGTEVTVVPSVPIQSGYDVDGANKGEEHVYRLNRGEVIQIAQKESLVGTRISANKSVAVFGGHECMNIPSESYWACETEQLQLSPVRSWGHEYAAVPYLPRRANEASEEYFYRIVAAASGTALTYDPVRPNGAPPVLAAGEAVIFSSHDPFVVKSQDADHPFAVYSYMSGAAFEQSDLDDGDPEFTPVVPAEQYLGRYVFFVDPSFRNSQIVVVRSRAAGKEFAPVELDCGGTLDGWAPVGTSGEYEFTRLRLTDKFVNQHVGTGTCGPGRHEITSQGTFGVTVWGTDYFASYAYPGGAALRTLNTLKPITH